ncbi:MAG: hypothetical protein GZ088_03265 [Acidipila sp.]|nr:hypothetical protein [Acidipila sp.]
MGTVGESPTRMWLLAILVIAYTGLAAYWIHNWIFHFVIYLLVLQHLILLPVFIILLRGSARAGDGTGFPSLPSCLAAGLLFFTISLALGWYTSQGVWCADESAYRFQAKIFATGRLTAPALAGVPLDNTDTPPEVFYTHHIYRNGRWFVKYTPGWPLILALGMLAGLPWAISPLLGGLCLWTTHSLARRVFGSKIANLSVWIVVLSPIFITNVLGTMSHALCALCIVAACLLCFEGLKTLKALPFAGMFALGGFSCFVRPLTGFAITAVLGLSTLWYLRMHRRLWLRVFVLACIFGALTVGSFLQYDKKYTGSYLVTPYAAARGLRVPAEISGGTHQTLENLRVTTRFALQDTLLFAVPFVFLFAVYACSHEKERLREVRILMFFFPAVVVAYLIQVEGSSASFGERYYFESLFAVAILGARGLILFVENNNFSRRTVNHLLLGALFLQLVMQVVSVHKFVYKLDPTRKIQEALNELTLSQAVVFMAENERLVPRHFNLNSLDWARADLVFLIDPGPGQRAAWACREGRSNWVSLEYGLADDTIHEAFGQVAPGDCSTLPRDLAPSSAMPHRP